jgi:hypothetical protein
MIQMSEAKCVSAERQKNRINLILCLVLTGACVLCTFTLYNVSGGQSPTRFAPAFTTIKTSATELWQSVLGYLQFVFTMKTPTTSPITPPNNETNIIPNSPEQFGDNTKTFWGQLFNGENFANYTHSLDGILITILTFLPFIIMFVFLIRAYIKRIFTAQNNNYNKDSRPLKIYKKLSTKIYTPTKRFIINFWVYASDHKFTKIWLVIWLFNFNVLRFYSLRLLSAYISLRRLISWHFIISYITRLQIYRQRFGLFRYGFGLCLCYGFWIDGVRKLL